MGEPLEKKNKRSFQEAWFSDTQYKFWIRKVPLNDELYHCTVCKKNLSCNARISRHANSTPHKENLQKATFSLTKNDDINETISQTKQKFRQEWLDIELFKPWLREASHDKTLFFCEFCEKYMDARLSHIYRHADSAVHLKIAADRNKERKETDEDINITDESLLPKKIFLIKRQKIFSHFSKR
ncbi:uncharacterized protein LOC118647771 [Monomorium pharaonis]|uniref:uncharacterized protein LOC118647771 n=1 Tax=Monomorium pharaonis TaxID=307658 RepID=UPI0017467C70|nr:uncharacterized protein LOC118647771 [Monomorium pharaonis]